MALSAFDDKTAAPRAHDLAEVLGRTSALWDELVAALAAEYQPLDQTWKFAGAKWGWSLQLRHRKRTILYLTPRHKHFHVGFALGEKAVRACHEAGLPSALLRTIDAATKYAEGRAVRLEVRSKKAAGAVKRLAAIKMAH